MKKRIVCLTLALMMTAGQVATVSASREEELREEIETQKAIFYLQQQKGKDADL